MFRYAFAFLISCYIAICASAAAAERFNIYIDADFSNSTWAAEAIELGVKTALAEVDHEVVGISLDVVRKDHRGNSKRTLSNLRAFQADPQAIAVMGGSLSPPYLSNQRFVNENGILLLLPWSAAGPITRAKSDQDNWIFRLSVDDTKAGPFLVSRALEQQNCDHTALLLIDTGWGRVNSISMQAAFNALGASPPSVFMFSAGLGSASARTLAQSVAASRADCVIMLSGVDTGALIAREIYQTIPEVKVISHWGILAGDFQEQVPHEIRDTLRIEVLQTCGLQAEQIGRSELTQALESASRFGMPYRMLSDVPSSTGFVHGYDLTKLLLAAMRQAAEDADWSDASIEARRGMIRTALENLSAPVHGILKSYNRPFAAYSQASPDAHEALGLPDFCMASFADNGRLVLADSPVSVD